MAKSVGQAHERLAYEPAVAGIDRGAVLHRSAFGKNGLSRCEVLCHLADWFAEQSPEGIENAQLNGAPQRIAVSSRADRRGRLPVETVRKAR